MQEHELRLRPQARHRDGCVFGGRPGAHRCVLCPAFSSPRLPQRLPVISTHPVTPLPHANFTQALAPLFTACALLLIGGSTWAWSIWKFAPMVVCIAVLPCVSLFVFLAYISNRTAQIHGYTYMHVFSPLFAAIGWFLLLALMIAALDCRYRVCTRECRRLFC